MKKFLKFLASLIAIVSVIGGAYYVVKKFILNDDDTFEDFDDDFEDFDDGIDTSSDNRGYVTLNPGEETTDTETEDDLDETDEEEESNTTDDNEENDFLIEE